MTVRKPMLVPGVEYSGTVEAVGGGVTAFEAGDAVCGTATGLRYGANAEYLCVPEQSKQSVIVKKPEALTFDQAAASIVGAMTAVQLLKRAGAGAGQRVLVYGASGAVGTFAVQLAKHFGCAVTGVCSTGNMELVKGLGADEVIDYTKTESTADLRGAETGSRYDLIFDAVGKLSKSRCKALLAAGGSYTSTRRPTKERAEELEYVLGLVAAGEIRPVIDREYALEEIVEAHRYVDSGRKRGTVIVRVS